MYALNKGSGDVRGGILFRDSRAKTFRGHTARISDAATPKRPSTKAATVESSERLVRGVFGICFPSDIP